MTDPRRTYQWHQARTRRRRLDGHACVRCGSNEGIQVDHVQSLADGGQPYAMSNLQTLCHRCHALKTRAQARARAKRRARRKQARQAEPRTVFNQAASASPSVISVSPQGAVIRPEGGYFPTGGGRD